jgi:hypothetical protein
MPKIKSISKRKRFLSIFSAKFPLGESGEMEFPKGADMKPPREFFIPLGGSFLTSSL